MKRMILNSGREKSLLRRHPWVFSGAVKSVEAGAQAGDVLTVRAEDGRFLATAAYSEKSQIVGRVLSFDERDVIDEAFYRLRIKDAIARRAHLSNQTDAVRLVHAESDGLPGLIADRYGEVIVVQLLTAGIDPQRELIARLLKEETGARSIYERSDADVRELEGLPTRSGVIVGDDLPAETLMHENGLKFAVDIASGHKTGFYLDQRDNRALTRSLSRDADVLNCFCYTGTMSVAALAGG
ncbi:MAG: class I SAM-dependent rRNA methyltransferase, partial [Betaproteobacteria bacterium]